VRTLNPKAPLARSVLAVLGLALVPPVAAENPVGSMRDMADMMRGMGSMMRLWNTFTGNDAQAGSWMDPWSWYGDWWQQLPAEAMTGAAGGASGWPWEWMSAMPGGWDGGAAGEPRLDGTWRGTNGAILIIRGSRFRILADGQQCARGAFLTYGPRFVAYCAQADVTQSYEFEYRGDRFALKDRYGEIVLYARQSGPDLGPSGPAGVPSGYADLPYPRPGYGQPGHYGEPVYDGEPGYYGQPGYGGRGYGRPAYPSPPGGLGYGEPAYRRPDPWTEAPPRDPAHATPWSRAPTPGAGAYDGDW
jgi:hypothetical protein